MLVPARLVPAIKKKIASSAHRMAAELSADTLHMVLASTDAWVTRLTCQAFRRNRALARWVGSSVVESVERCQLALALGFPGCRVCELAACAGNLDVLLWARRSGYSYVGDDDGRATLHTPVARAIVERILAVRWCRTADDWELLTCTIAAARGHRHVLEHAQANSWTWQRFACPCAASGGHLALLKWARDRGCPWGAKTCSAAALGGHLETLRWASAQGCHLSRSTCHEAARGGHLEVLRWARAHGCPWNEATCARAALMGNLEVLKWLRDAGCPWDRFTCSSAARNGHLETLKWARAHGCPWTACAVSFARSGGHWEMLEWMREQGVDIGQDQ